MLRTFFIKSNVIIFCCLLALWGISAAQNASTVTQPSPPQVSNASPLDEDAVMRLLSQLDSAIAARYPNAVKFYGLESLAQQYGVLTSRTQITHLATAPGGALVKVNYHITGKTSQAANAYALKSSSLEFWLNRTNEGFAFSQRVWSPPMEAQQLLANTGLGAWQESATGILHLIAEHNGGRWIPLRQMRWNGTLASGPVLNQLETAQQITPQAPIDNLWLQRQLDRYTEKGKGTVHLFLQAGSAGWIGIGSAWQDDSHQKKDSSNALKVLRAKMNGQDFTSANAHRDFGKALAEVGLFVEAANQLQQASALSPASVDPEYLAKVTKLRSQDPELLAATQLQNEARIGLDPTHPTYQINALTQQLSRAPSPLTALRLGDEYSQLGEDDRASQMLQKAQTLLADQGTDELSNSDSAWVKVLFDHLQERIRNAALKPPNIIRSSLFTVRCWKDDPNSLPLLAALEESQHTVYADFNIPMNNTEVLLWQNQADFQRYTTRFSATADSEFVTALTLTKLINTAQGPVVLGEEMNIYSNRDTTWFSTVAHEYGHVAVRQMSKARNVPVWLNEGIASAVQGGYDGYKPRLRAAAQNGNLLSMDDLLRWQVDGERAFLAYSQANSMIDYIVQHWGRNAVLQILRLIASDTSPDEAFSMTLQLNQRQLWQQWRRNGIP